jgi:hypothetical protein
MFDGMAISMSFYGHKDGLSPTAKMALYDGETNSFIAETKTITINSVTPQWWTAEFVAPVPIVANKVYYLVFFTSGADRIWYYWWEDGGGVSGQSVWPSWPNSLWTGSATCSVYCTYITTERCQWITAKGGAAGLDVSEVFQIIDSYVFQTPPTGYTFVPTITQVMGIIDYYLGFIDSGNQKTGCSF